MDIGDLIVFDKFDGKVDGVVSRMYPSAHWQGVMIRDMIVTSLSMGETCLLVDAHVGDLACPMVHIITPHGSVGWLPARWFSKALTRDS